MRRHYCPQRTRSELCSAGGLQGIPVGSFHSDGISQTRQHLWWTEMNSVLRLWLMEGTRLSKQAPWDWKYWFAHPFKNMETIEDSFVWENSGWCKNLHGVLIGSIASHLFQQAPRKGSQVPLRGILSQIVLTGDRRSILCIKLTSGQAIIAHTLCVSSDTTENLQDRWP